MAGGGVIEYGSIGSTLLLTTPDRLYIVSMSQLISHKNKVPAAAIICYRDKDAPAELSATQRTKYKKTPLILLDKETSFGPVWESLQDDLTAPYDPLLFQNKLLSLALSCHDVTDLLTAATECTGLPFSLHNTVPSLFAYSRAGEMVVTNPMGADVMETFCTPEFLTNLPDNALLDSVRERNGPDACDPAQRSAEDPAHPSMCGSSLWGCSVPTALCAPMYPPTWI